MKRTYQANISGRVFYIDEDAFDLLNNYFDELHRSFSGTEGEEIVGDIETRISELFAEQLTENNNVIVLADVNRVIETIGSPADISSADDDNESAVPPIDDSDNAASHDAPADTPNTPFISINLPGRKKLYRNLNNKVLGGVIGGLAEYLGWNANIMRVLLVLLILCTKFVSFVPVAIIYLIAWMIIPPADTAGRVLEMHGDDINVDSVGQAVIASNEPRNIGCVGSTFEFLGKLLMCFVGLTTGVMAIGLFIAFVSVLALTVMLPFTNPVEWSHIVGEIPYINGSYMILVVIMFMTLSLTIMLSLLTWGAGIVVFRFPAIKRHLLITLIVVAALLFVVGMALFTIAA